MVTVKVQIKIHSKQEVELVAHIKYFVHQMAKIILCII